MIKVFHDNRSVVTLEGDSENDLKPFLKENIISTLFALAKKFPQSILVWCHISQKGHFNEELIRSSFNLRNTMMSFNEVNYVPNQIGYIEDSPFLKVNKQVKYPTWLMSSLVGAIHTSQLLKFQNQIENKVSFDYFLNSIAKLGMPNGLFCYSEPKLLIDSNTSVSSNKMSGAELFKFVKEHYKNVWSILLLLNYIIHERKFPVLSYFRSIFIKRKRLSLKFDLESIGSNMRNFTNPSIDVIVPTLKRKKYVKDFITDLSKQSILPKQVIIIEQNEDVNAVSELDFISGQKWPFKIVHKFIHRMGACNARNIGLKQVKSDYTFLADDDIRIKNNFIESALGTMENFGLKAATLSCLVENEIKLIDKVIQWTAFGSGCSIVNSNVLKGISFNMKYEFGYGEDMDFGMQLRNKGADIIYLPSPEIKHLKAPIGGFRSKFEHPWETEKILPKPSPTVMLNRLSNSTKWQLMGYKTRLFIQFYKKQSIKNPIRYLTTFSKQWELSELWALKLKQQNV